VPTPTQIFDDAKEMTKLDMNWSAGPWATIAVTNAAILRDINKVILDFCRDVRHRERSISFTPVNGQAEYAFDSAAFGKRLITPLAVYRNGIPFLRLHDRAPGITPEPVFNMMNPHWRTNATAGETYTIIENSGDILQMHPAPATSFITGATFIVDAIAAPANVTSGTVTTDIGLPEKYRRGLALSLVLIQTQGMVTDIDAMARFQSYQDELRREINALRTGNETQATSLGVNYRRLKRRV